MEKVKRIKLLPCTHKLNRLGHHCTYRQRGTATGVTVKLREHHSIKIKTVIELLGCVHSILTSH